MGRYSQQQTEANRARIMSESGRLLRERGLDGIGVADLMAAAGLTHGGFYRHFSSKEELMILAAEQLAKDGAAQWKDVAAVGAIEGSGGVQAIFDRYLSAEHRDAPGQGCAIAALGAEFARMDTDARTRVASAVDGMIDALADQFDDPAETARDRALVAYSAMIGAMILARLGVGLESESGGDPMKAVRDHLR